MSSHSFLTLSYIGRSRQGICTQTHVLSGVCAYVCSKVPVSSEQNLIFASSTRPEIISVQQGAFASSFVRCSRHSGAHPMLCDVASLLMGVAADCSYKSHTCKWR